MNRLFLILCFLLFILLKVDGQELGYVHYGVSDGLPSSEVYQSFQDSRGYMWFATDRGLVRYDGKEFRTYTTQDGLCSEVIFGFHQDYKNRIWLYGYTGCLSYIDEGKIYSLPFKDEVFTKHYVINSMYVDKTDTIWLGLNFPFNFLKIDPKGYVYQDSIRSKTGLFVLKEIDSSNFITAVTSSGGNRKHLIQWLDTSITFQLDVKANSFTTGTGYIKSKDNSIYHLASQELIKLKGKKLVSSTLLASGGNMSLYQDQEKNIWVGLVDSGAVCFNEGVLEPPPKSILKGQSVSSILQDSEGGFWFTTLNDGIYYLPSFKIQVIEDKLLPRQSFTEIIHLDGDIISGTKQGNLYLINSDQPSKLKKLYGFKSEIYDLFKMNDSAIYVSAQALDGQSYLSNTHKIRIQPTKSGYKNGIYYPRTKKYYSSQSYGLASWSLESPEEEQTPIESAVFKDIKVVALSVVNDHLLIGCKNGLWSFNGLTAENISEEHAVLNKEVSDIQYLDSVLFLATRKNGVIVHNMKSDSIWTIHSIHGLTTQNISKIVIQEPKIMWAATKNGLYKIVFDSSYQSASSFLIDSKMGLSSNEVNDITLAENKVWVANQNGISHFNTDLNLQSNTTIPLYIQSIVINDTLAVDTAYSNAFDHTASSFEFNYSAVSFRLQTALKYEYFLEGFDRQWHSTKNNSVRYMLSPGDYNFKVRTLLNNKRNETFLTNYSFSINKPFYSENWFTATVVLLIISLLYMLLKWRFELVQQRSNLELLMVKSQHKALTAQLKPHFIFNALNSIHSYVLKNKPTESSNYIIKFSQLLRKVLNHSTKTFVSLKEELDLVKGYLEIEKIRFKDQLEYRFEIDDQIDLDEIEVPSQLIQPYVENAVWHGIMPKKTAGQVIIKVSRTKNEVQLIVEDNGVGRQASSPKTVNHESLGMDINMERIELLNSILEKEVQLEIVDLKDRKSNPCGTKIILTIPLVTNSKMKTYA